MKKIFFAILLLLGFIGTISAHTNPDEPPKTRKRIGGPTQPSVKKHNQTSKTIRTAEAVYKMMDFSHSTTVLDKDVFVQAFLGYQNLLKEGKVAEGNHILSICDFSLSANVPRIWVMDLRRKKVLYNTLVAHGQGTGEEFAEKFSNIENSHQSSLGFYITANTYNGNNGYSLKLYGMDVGYNHNAFDRAIVIHGANYVSESFIKANKRLGRSWGCPALPQDKSRVMIDRIKEGSVLYVYHPQQQYLSASKWINTPIPTIDEMYMEDPNLPGKKPKYIANTNPQSSDTMRMAAPAVKKSNSL